MLLGAGEHDVPGNAELDLLETLEAPNADGTDHAVAPECESASDNGYGGRGRRGGVPAGIVPKRPVWHTTN